MQTLDFIVQHWDFVNWAILALLTASGLAVPAGIWKRSNGQVRELLQAIDETSEPNSSIRQRAEDVGLKQAAKLIRKHLE